MALTDFQRKHPHRSIGERNPQSYLERSFMRAELADMEHWWNIGAVQAALSRATPAAATDTASLRAAGLMRAFLAGMDKLPTEAKALWWPRLWAAGAEHMTDRHGGWLYALVDDRTSCHFLLGHGVSPHTPMRGRRGWDDSITSACVAMLGTVLEASTQTYRPPTRAWVEDAWEHLAVLWAQPGWQAEQQVLALQRLTQKALWTDGEHPDQPRFEALRDDLLAQCPDRWSLGQSDGRPGLLYHWLHAAPRLHPHDADDALIHWRTWGEALMRGTPPASPEVRTIPLDWFNPVHHAQVGPFVARMAEWGLACWDVEKPRPSLSRDSEVRHPKTVMDALQSTPEQGMTADLAPGWWEGLVATTHRLGPPPAEWQAAALGGWLRATLNHPQDPPATPEDRCPPGLRTAEQQETWIARWTQWGDIGGWAEQGLPHCVCGVFQGHQSTFSDLPTPLLKALLPLWQRWGFLPRALPAEPPRARGGGQPAAPLKPMKPHHTWMMWSRLCADPGLQPEALALLATRGDHLMDAACLAHVTQRAFEEGRTDVSAPSVGWKSFMQAACGAHPQWLTNRSSLVMAAALQRGQLGLVNALLDLGAPLPQDWSDWSSGLNETAETGHTFTAQCPWLALAYRMNGAGLSLDVGPAECRPLSRAVNYWSDSVGDYAARGLLQAGADPDGVVQKKRQTESCHDGAVSHRHRSPTPNEACWAAAILGKRLAGTIEETDEQRRRPRM